ncbi:MAG: hypothetical protein GY795_43415 [Desulfobacterales bacterium]|nr:hypothetical protein [Desulfobacterales bacterium]
MDQCIKFKGEKVEYYNYRRLLIITFLESFVINLAIFGEENLQCLIFSTLCLLLLLYLPSRIFPLCGFRSAKISGFMLDDNAQKIITEKGRIIPYNKVKEISFVKDGDSLAVLVSLGIFTKHIILITGNIKKENELFRELKNRFVKVSTDERYSVIPTAIIVFMIVSVTCYVYFKSPETRIFSEKRIQKTQKFSEAGAERFTFNKVSFSLPKNYKLTEKKNAQYTFYNQTEGVLIYVYSVSVLSKLHDILPFGLKNDYELFNVIFNSYTGIVPFVVKLEFVRDYACETLKIYEIRKKEFRGFLMTGTVCTYKNNKIINKVYLTFINKKSDRQINFYIISENGIKDELADMIINGLE